jgi:hypothetical protein
MANTNFPPQSIKAKSIKGFGENIIQLSLCVNVSHLVPFPHDISRSGVALQGVSFFYGHLKLILHHCLKT